MVWNWDKDDIRGREREREREEREREGERYRLFEKDIYNNTKYIIVLNSRYIEIYLKLLDHTTYICFHSNKNVKTYYIVKSIRSLYYL